MQLARSQYSDKLILYVIFAVITLSSVCFAIDPETEDPIRSGGGARPVGLAHAMTAAADDINAAYFNPAGLVGIKSAQLTGMYYTKVYGNYHYFVSAGAAPTQYGVFGAGFVSSGIGQVPFGPGITPESFEDYTDNLFFASYADSVKRFYPPLKNVFYGVNLKFFSKGTSGSHSFTASGTNFDIGLKYIPFRGLSLGLNKMNVLGGEIEWSSGQREFFPTPLFLGACYKNADNGQLYTFDMEFPSLNRRHTLYHVALEAPFDKRNKAFLFRIGIDETHDVTADKVAWNPSFGVGILLKGLVIDYAFHPYYDDPGYTSHYVSISFVGEYESGIRAVAGEGDRKIYPAGEAVPVNVYVPFEADSVVAISPKGENIELTYDNLTNSWNGKWTVPEGFRSNSYYYDVVVYDLSGNIIDGRSDNFFVKERVPVVLATSETKVSSETATTREVANISTEDAYSVLGRYLHRKIDPDELVHRNDMAVIISNIKGYSISTGEGLPFKDVDPASFEAPYIKACYDRKVLKGYSADMFGPERQIILSELIMMISDSEPDKAKRIEIWSYLKGKDRKETATFRRLVDVFIESRYLQKSDLLIQ